MQHHSKVQENIKHTGKSLDAGLDKEDLLVTLASWITLGTIRGNRI